MNIHTKFHHYNIVPIQRYTGYISTLRHKPYTEYATYATQVITQVTKTSRKKFWSKNIVPFACSKDETTL